MATKPYKKLTTTVLTIFFVLFSFIYSAIGSIVKEENKRDILNKVSLLQIPFIENKGQIEEGSVKYYVKTLGGTVFVTNDGELVYSLPKFEKEKGITEGWVIKETFVEASVSNVKGEEEATARVSYFKGKDPLKWKTNIPTCNILNLGYLYKGIEVKLKAYGNNLEKLFYVKPKADLLSIKVKVEGARSLKVNENGELEVETGLGVVKFTKPVAYQEKKDKKNYVEVSYVVSDKEYSFMVGDYDRTKVLVIDPLLASTFLGGSQYDQCGGVAIDSSGNVYVSGGTISEDFPKTPGAYDESYNGGNRDGFVAKFDADLKNLLASSFLGGSSQDHCGGFMSIDIDGNVYVVGDTWSSDFPRTEGAYVNAFNGKNEFFVAKLDGSLQILLASTFLGGSDYDWGHSMRIHEGNVYVGGRTWSTNFPTTKDVYKERHSGGGNDEGFIAKLDGNLQELLAATYLGGTGTDWIHSITINSQGQVYAICRASHNKLPLPITPEPYESSFKGGGEDCYIAKLDGDLENLLAATFLGGSGADYLTTIATDSAGDVYVFGRTNSSDFPIPPSEDPDFYEPYDRVFNGHKDAIVAKLDGDLQNLLAATFLGGVDGDDHAGRIFLDGHGNVYLSGTTNSSDFPTTPGAYDRIFNGSGSGINPGDAFVAKLDGELKNLLASTFLGGSDRDCGIGICMNNNGDVYVAGSTSSSDFPWTPDAYDTSYNGGETDSFYGDSFVAKLNGALSGGFRFVVMADSRNNDCDSSTKEKARDCIDTSALQKVMRSVQRLDPPPEFILFVGDMAYGRKVERLHVENELDAWRSIIDEVMSPNANSPSDPSDSSNPLLSYTNKKIYPVFGGHERVANVTDKWSAFDNVFFLGNNGENDQRALPRIYCNKTIFGHTVYYFDYENARFFVLNNDLPVHEFGNPQENWLKTILEDANPNNRKPLNFFFHHEPAYGTQSHLLRPIVTMDAKPHSKYKYIDTLGRNNMNNNATLIFSGHEHQYFRRRITPNSIVILAESIPESENTGTRTAYSYKWLEDDMVRDRGNNHHVPLLHVEYTTDSGESRTFEARIANESDAAEELDDDNGTVVLDSSDLEFMKDSAREPKVQKVVGMRWDNVQIPQSATITKAYIEFTAKEAGQSPADVRFYGQAAAYAEPFKAESNNLSDTDRQKTTVYVDWTDINGWAQGEKYRTSPDVDLTQIIQEIVNRPDWTNVAFDEVKTGTCGAPFRPNGPNDDPYEARLIELTSPWSDSSNEPHHYAIVDVVGDVVTLVVRAVEADNTEHDIDSLAFSGSVLNEGVPECFDMDRDGVLDLVEGTDDLDNDGIPDFQDPDTARVAATTGGGEISFDLPEDQHPDITLSNVTAITTTHLSLDQETKPDNDFPFGLVGADITGIQQGETVIVTLILPTDVPVGYKYYGIASWHPIEFDSNDGDNRINVSLIDGGTGDRDGKANCVISHLGGLAAPKTVIVNDLVIFEPIGSTYRSTYDTTGCTEGFVGKFSFDARLTNTSDSSLTDLVVKVAELTNENLMQNADGGPGGVGSQLTVSMENGYSDGELGPEESIIVPFTICLKEFSSFRFFVDVLGTVR